MKKNPKLDKFVGNIIENKATGKGTQKSAFLKAGFKAKNSQIAKSNASKLMKHPEVKKQIQTFMEELETAIPQTEIIEKMKRLINTNDIRTVVEIIEKWLRLKGAYPDPRVRIGKLDEIDEIYTPLDDKLGKIDKKK